MYSMFDINEEMTYLVYVMQKRMRRQMSAALDRDDITLEQLIRTVLTRRVYHIK